MLRRGQAMLETVLAVLVITFVFLALFKLSHLLTGKILLEHAAMRVARARAVGLNEFMCQKIARVVTIPVAGRRLWPTDEDFDDDWERARLRIYMQTRDAAIARGVLEYEGWDRLDVDPGRGVPSLTAMHFDLFEGTMDFELEGRAEVNEDYAFYLTDQGR